MQKAKFHLNTVVLVFVLFRKIHLIWEMIANRNNSKMKTSQMKNKQIRLHNNSNQLKSRKNKLSNKRKMCKQKNYRKNRKRKNSKSSFKLLQLNLEPRLIIKMLMMMVKRRKRRRKTKMLKKMKTTLNNKQSRKKINSQLSRQLNLRQIP